MGSKTRNSKKTKKGRGTSNLREWRILKSFGLNQNNVKKKKKVVSSPSSDENMCIDNANGMECTISDMIIDEAVESTSSKERGPLVTDTVSIQGRRIVHISYFLQELVNMSDHAPQYGCTFKNMDIIGEICRGFRFGIIFKCNMCHEKKTVWSEPELENYMDVNSAAVAGAMTSGGGYTCLQKVFGAMDVRCMNQKTYDKKHTLVAKGWETSSLHEMRSAAEEEIILARQRGDVDKDNVPLLTVVADGSWAKRSYKKNTIHYLEWQSKYGAREREKRREMDEALLMKDLYEKHNKRFNEALSERIRKHLDITEILLDETKEEIPTLPT